MKKTTEEKPIRFLGRTWKLFASSFEGHYYGSDARNLRLRISSPDDEVRRWDVELYDKDGKISIGGHGLTRKQAFDRLRERLQRMSRELVW
jgi:hypothetical protein